MYQGGIMNNKEIINIIKRINFYELNDNKFIEMLIKIYGVDYIKGQYLEIVSIKKQKEYNRIIEIGTFMHVTKRVSERLGDIYNSWDQLYQVSYKVAVGANSKLKNGMVLMKDKIKYLIENNELMIIEEKLKLSDSEIVLNEKLEKMPNEGLSILRKEFTKERIISDLENNYVKKRVLKKYN